MGDRGGPAGRAVERTVPARRSLADLLREDLGLDSLAITTTGCVLGTALLSFFGVQADKLPKDPNAAYEQAREGFAEKNLTAFEPSPTAPGCRRGFPVLSSCATK